MIALLPIAYSTGTSDIENCGLKLACKGQHCVVPKAGWHPKAGCSFGIFLFLIFFSTSVSFSWALSNILDYYLKNWVEVL